MEKITFSPEDGEDVELFVVEQTRLGGNEYILVTDTQEDEGDAWILKDISAPDDRESIYTMVDDETELDAVASIFSDLLEDIDLE